MLLILIIAILAAAIIVAAFIQLRRDRTAGETRGGPTTLEPPPVEEVEAPSTEAAPEAQAPPAEAPPEEAPAVEVPSAEELEELVEAPPERPRLRDRLGKARAFISDSLAEMRLRRSIDDTTWDELEETLVLADVGVGTATSLLDDLRTQAKEETITDGEGLLDALKADVAARLATADRSLAFSPGEVNVWMFVGVNGTGKTTTIGKIARREVTEGHQTVLVAGDTFRAAAAEQLGLWAERTGAELIRGQEGADPGSVVFDGMDAAQGRDADLVLIDTAGRLHTNVNLMEELAKLRRIVDRTPGALKEVLLVIDATTGQNGLAQARQFAESVDVTGVALTKLDGTAKGGIVLAIQQDLGIPVKLVGVGEGPDDLIEFDPDEFAEALFS